MAAYYNENDKFCAQWLRNLISAGHIAPGDVDDRSILNVRSSDLAGYDQCHFFAGIGIWSHALRLASWPDSRPVWTGSCPCQPLSVAGQQLGHADERHLWPAFHDLIAECQPAALFGEQVAGADGREWFSAVRADLEGMGYACGAADLCAAGVGAPHIRQRLFFVANSTSTRCSTRLGKANGEEERRRECEPERFGASDGVAHANRTGLEGCDAREMGRAVERGSEASRMGDTSSQGSGRHTRAISGPEGKSASERGRTRGQPDQLVDAGAVDGVGNSHAEGLSERTERDSQQEARSEVQHRAGTVRSGAWDAIDWIACRDGKTRPTKSGIFPLVDGYPNRVGVLRAAGNAIVAPLAAAFIETCKELID